MLQIRFPYVSFSSLSILLSTAVCVFHMNHQFESLVGVSKCADVSCWRMFILKHAQNKFWEISCHYLHLAFNSSLMCLAVTWDSSIFRGYLGTQAGRFIIPSTWSELICSVPALIIQTNEMQCKISSCGPRLRHYYSPHLIPHTLFYFLSSLCRGVARTSSVLTNTLLPCYPAYQFHFHFILIDSYHRVPWNGFHAQYACAHPIFFFA